MVKFHSMFISFFFLHVSGGYVPIIRRNNCIYATLGICYSVCLTVSYAGCTLHIRQSSTQSDKYQVSHRYIYFSWWWAHSRPKHVEKRNKHTMKNCPPSWLYLQDYTGMHVQENIRFLCFLWSLQRSVQMALSSKPCSFLHYSQISSRAFKNSQINNQRSISNQSTNHDSFQMPLNRTIQQPLKLLVEITSLNSKFGSSKDAACSNSIDRPIHTF